MNARDFLVKPPPGRSLLSRDIVLEHIKLGNIVIDPICFKHLADANESKDLDGNPRDLKTTSYDVRLGRYFYREQKLPHGKNRIFNPFIEEQVRQRWGQPCDALTVHQWKEHGIVIHRIPDDCQVILINPGQTILAHTLEFIGGRTCVSTEMRARSSMGRIGITVCKCAGWGDLGYINRWTMEITNHMEECSIPLVVGMRIAQIPFFQVDELATSYATEGGKYQTADDILEIKKLWRPDAMLPKLYKDYELKEGFPKDDLEVSNVAKAT